MRFKDGIQFDTDKLREAIFSRGMTVRGFSESLNYDSSMVAQILKRGRCRATTLKTMADGLKIPMEEFLLDETGTMNVRLDAGAKMPVSAHEWDAGYDLFSMESVTIAKGQAYKFDTGVHMQIPHGYGGILVSKSSLCDIGLESTGLIDADYTGSIKVVLRNKGQRAVRIHEYQKISQIVLVPIIKPKLVAVDHLEETERGNGGFGSSGKF